MVAPHDDLWAQMQGLTTRMDPVPANVLRMAKESLAWRDTDAALAALLAEDQFAGVRAGERPELLTFAAGELTIEVELTMGGATVSLIGQLVPPQAARIKVDHADGPGWAQSDELGRFALSGVARGHLRLTCYPATGGPVQTEWTLV
jgi:hypothetical protein